MVAARRTAAARAIVAACAVSPAAVAAAGGSPAPASISAIPHCMTEGFGYTDAAIKHVNGAWVDSAKTCQTTCASRPDCKFFTWNQSSMGCYLQGAGSSLTKMAGVTSGPKRCPRAPASAAQAAAEPGQAVDAAQAVSQTTVKAKAATIPAVGTTPAFFLSTGTATTTTTTTSTEEGGFLACIPWWGWLLIALGILAIGVAACAGMRGSSKDKKKKKKQSKKVASEHSRRSAEDRGVDSSLMDSPASGHAGSSGPMPSMNFQPLPSLSDVSAPLPAYGAFPQAGMNPQLQMGSVPPQSMPQAVLQPPGFPARTMAYAGQPMAIAGPPMGYASPGSYMPVAMVPRNMA